MKLQWKKVFVETTIWLATEIVLNFVGLDNLADYSEFIYKQEVLLSGRLNRSALVANSFTSKTLRYWVASTARRSSCRFSFSSGVLSYSPDRCSR